LLPSCDAVAAADFAVMQIQTYFLLSNAGCACFSRNFDDDFDE